MSFVSQLVRDTDTGKICLQLKLGSNVAIHEIPDHLATASTNELKEYFDGVVPEMVKGLQARSSKAKKKIKKKVKR